MIIVPLQNDTIQTKDAGNFKVLSYTNLKSEPAVYIDVDSDENTVVYFQDIISINGVSVEYHTGNKVFTALGPVKRKYSLPQPNDVINTEVDRIDIKTDDRIIKSIKLQNKKVGISKGLVVCDDIQCYELTSINDIERAEGGEKFNKNGFLSYYSDYLPMNYRK